MNVGDFNDVHMMLANWVAQLKYQLKIVKFVAIGAQLSNIKTWQNCQTAQKLIIKKELKNRQVIYGFALILCETDNKIYR